MRHLKFVVTWENNPEHHSPCPEDPGQLPISVLVCTQGQAVAWCPGLQVLVPQGKLMGSVYSADGGAWCQDIALSCVSDHLT